MPGKLRRAARGQPCMVRIPGHCNHDPTTSVLAHINGGGMAMKKSDLLASICCSSCHDVLDGRVPAGIDRDRLMLWHWQGVGRTLELWQSHGLVKIDGED